MLTATTWLWLAHNMDKTAESADLSHCQFVMLLFSKPGSCSLATGIRTLRSQFPQAAEQLSKGSQLLLTTFPACI